MKKVVLSFSIFLTLLFPFSVKAEETVRELVTLSKCVDGDTAKFVFPNGETYSTRFLAVDTPETVHPTKGEEAYGKQASEYTCKALSNAKKIELEYDSNSEKKDHYDRVLAWIFVDDELLQVKLIRDGLAEVTYLYGDYKYTSLLKDEEAVAKKNQVGQWSSKKEVVKEIVSSPKKETKKKGFLEQVFDYTIGFLFDSIGDFLDGVVKSLEDML